MPNPFHILIRMRPNQSVSELAKVIKANSSKWINIRKFLNVKFK
jgi:REP element-mobilizing transposase RayT